MANIKSQIKRIKQNEKRHQRNKSVKSGLKTAVRKFREAADAGDKEQAVLLGNDAADSGDFQVGIRLAYELRRPVVNGAKVVTPDVEASNGVIHVIDTVLMPPAS